MDIAKRKEQFNIAYVHAIAAQAGLNPGRLEVDDESIDLELGGRGFKGAIRNPRVALQLKCTSRNLISGEVIKFPLLRKNYDDLRGTDVICPRYLAVLLVPGQPEEWVRVTMTTTWRCITHVIGCRCATTQARPTRRPSPLMCRSHSA